MVEDVCKLHGEGGADAFRKLEVLGQRHIHIPPVQAAQVTDSTATGIEAQNAASKHRISPLWVCKVVLSFHVIRADAARTCYPAIENAAGYWSKGNGRFKCARRTGRITHLAEGLTDRNSTRLNS